MKVRFRLAASTAAAAALTLVATALAAAPASAATSPIGTGEICTSHNICLSANGNSGDFVFGKTMGADPNEENIFMGNPDVCGNTDKVDGDNTNCPFADGSGMNTKYSGDFIVGLNNISFVPPGDLGVSFFSDGALLIQSQTRTTGGMWVLAPVVAGGNTYYLVNVNESNSGTPTFACTQGVNQEIELTTIFPGNGACEWILPPQ